MVKFSIYLIRRVLVMRNFHTHNPSVASQMDYGSSNFKASIVRSYEVRIFTLKVLITTTEDNTLKYFVLFFKENKA